MCKYCEHENNDFVVLNDTKEYSGMEIALNRQGILRVRYYELGEYDLWFSEDIMNVEFCPICGRRLKR